VLIDPVALTVALGHRLVPALLCRRHVDRAADEGAHAEKLVAADAPAAQRELGPRVEDEHAKHPVIPNGAVHQLPLLYTPWRLPLWPFPSNVQRVARNR